MKTKKKMAALLLVTIGLTLICAKTIDAASWVWNWDTCEEEGWTDGSGGTIVTIEDGRNGTCGLGAQQPDTTQGTFPIVKTEVQDLDPGALVGGEFGEWLTMTGEIYVDVNRMIESVAGNYVDLEIYDEDSYGRFICYPDAGYGSIDDLGDEWFRYHLVNCHHLPYEGDVGEIFLHWNWNYNALESPVVFDNLLIAHEPPPISVQVDIRPQLCPNPLSIISKGMLPVAILGTNEFDVYDIEPTSIVVNGVSAVRHSYKDMATSSEPCVCSETGGPNGFLDLILDFKTEDILETLGEPDNNDELELFFTGQLIDGTPIEGSDCVLIRDEML